MPRCAAARRAAPGRRIRSVRDGRALDVSHRTVGFPEVVWFSNECAEDNHHVTMGKDDYFISADGLLMPAKKDQPLPDLRYFHQSKK